MAVQPPAAWEPSSSGLRIKRQNKNVLQCSPSLVSALCGALARPAMKSEGPRRRGPQAEPPGAAGCRPPVPSWWVTDMTTLRGAQRLWAQVRACNVGCQRSPLGTQWVAGRAPWKAQCLRDATQL